MRLERIFTHRLIGALRVAIPILVLVLIAIPSVNPMGKSLSGEMYSERQIASYLTRFFSALGVAYHLDASDPDHPNVIAQVEAGKSETILLEAHMDTVSHENMNIAPFDPRIENGLLYGRGSCDTKSALAVYLYALEQMLRRGYSWQRNLVLAAVHDEEFSFGGARKLAAMNLDVTFAIAGEPTSLHIIYAHKGVCRFLLSTQGRSAHAALPWLGESAIFKMGEVIKRLEAYAQHLREKPHPELGPATMNIGRIFGGETVNTVPSSCTVEIDHRLLPGENYETVRAAVEKSLENIEGYRLTPPYLEVPGVYNGKNDLACRALLRACQAVDWKASLRVHLDNLRDQDLGHGVALYDPAKRSTEKNRPGIQGDLFPRWNLPDHAAHA
jgi:acetylornithine deacetylase